MYIVTIVGFIAGYAIYLPLCFLQWNDAAIVYQTFYSTYFIFCFYFFTTVFMAVVYYKIGRALHDQTKQIAYMKIVCSNPVRRGAPGSCFSILKFILNRKTFLVCLVTVLCYAIGNIPISVWYILHIAGENYFLMENVWIIHLADVVRVACSHSENPLIYGILDKKLLTYFGNVAARRNRNHRETD